MSNKHKLSLIQVFPRVINGTKIVIGCFIAQTLQMFVQYF